MRDASAIAHVHVQSWLTTYAGIVPQMYLDSLDEAQWAALWQDWLTKPISVYVAEIEGAVVGFAGAGPIREPLDAYDAELYTLYLLEEVQGRGIGKALLGTLAEALVQKRHSSMVVWVLEQNPALHFYKKTGAQYLTTKQIDIAGTQLAEAALGWTNLASLRPGSAQ